MSILALGLSLAKFIPDIMNLFGGDEKDVEKAEKLISVAESVTGLKGQEAVNAIEINPELALLFKKQATEDKYFIELLDEQSRQRASNMYSTTGHEQANKIADQIITFNIYFVVGIALAQILSMALLPEMGETVKVVIGNICGYIIKGLLDERLQVCNFFFGSSMGSKLKDKNFNSK